MSKLKTKILMIVLAMLLVLPLIKIKPTNAASNTQIMKSSTGQDLKYRYSQEKVYGLSQYDYPTSEYRAVWVSTFVGDIPAYSSEEEFKSDATTLLDNIVKMGMNAMVFHVRTHNNALYKSDLNPIASWWKNVNFDEFDPLEWLITETHNRGIEFHAWMNPYRTGGYIGEDYPANHPCKNPDLVLTNSNGAKILDPGSEVVQDFIVETCMEFLERYDADAIHFDDYFYISGVATNLTGDEKRQNVDDFIEKLSDRMHQMNLEEGRAVQLGISPSGIYRNGGYSASPSYDANGNLVSPLYSNTSGFAHYDEYLYSDTKKWIDNEWIDYITPQAYWAMEHTGANFYELTRWWSWCVRYKKVNLYMGIGIYMPLESGTSASYWKLNKDEVKNQILNAGMYDEINGLCFYKYSSLLSTQNEIIKNGVDLITNDYWKKRIPGVVIGRYADTLPSVKVSGLNVNGTTLNWSEINNVFGYMVYQVPKGEALDQNNIEHLLVYTQDTKVENIDSLTYDYYISSVNRANVISSPTKLNGSTSGDYETVISQINSLPNPVTLNDEVKINSIRNIYNSLNSEDKTKVTNYQILVNAENTIIKLKALKVKVDNFLVNVDLNINTDRILPVEPNMKWSYKVIDDSSSYNIETGKRLKNYLTAYYIPLYLEITEDGVTYKQEVSVNLSLLKKGETGLIYRNDPSCMSENHQGQYTGTPSYIGWSNATITVDNQVLFIAKNNFFNLTSNTIPSCNWTSCAGVYYNDSESNIAMTIGQAFSTESSSTGYFVIGSNKTIKTVSETSTSDTSIVLLPKETLVIVRYLDGLINNTPFKPISNLTIGTSAYLTNYDEVEITPQEEASVVISLINTLPSSIQLSDEELVNEVKKAYDKLSNEAKAFVTNYNVLENAIQEIERIKTELIDSRKNAITTINESFNINNYSTNNKELINEIVNNAISRINASSNIQEINSICKSTIQEIKAIKTISEELDDYYTTNYEKFIEGINLDEYSETNKQTINEIIEELSSGYEQLKENNNVTIITIDTLFEQAQAKLRQIPTKAEELINAINNAKTEIIEYAEKNDYSSSSQDKIDLVLDSALRAITEATSETQLSEILAEYKKQIDSILPLEEELAQARKVAIEEVETYIKGKEDYQENQQIKVALDKILADVTDKINKEISQTRINNLVNKAKADVDIEIITIYANNCYEIAKSKVDFNDYSIENQTLINEYLDAIKSNIIITTTKDMIDERLKNAEEQINKVLTILEESRVKLRNKLNGLSKDGLADYQVKKVDELIKEYTIKISDAKSIKELEDLDSEITQKYKDILDIKMEEKPISGCCSKASEYMMFLLALGMVLSLILRKKH